MLFLIALLVIGSISLLAIVFFPSTEKFIKGWQAKREEKIEEHLDVMFYDKSPKQIMMLYYILPPVFAILGVLFLHHIIFLFAGAILGLFIPNMILQLRDKQRRFKFQNQILDAIMILSSSLKGGLSLLQAMEVVVEEMQPPMNQEIGLVIRENKMGVTLEDSLRHLGKKMVMEDLTLVINSILVARETGGDLTKVFSRLTTTIRDNRKLKDSIKTLTLQGRLQGWIMSVLPFLFVWFVLMNKKDHFDIMLKSDLGRTLLLVAVVLQVIGMLLIKKFSTIRV